MRDRFNVFEVCTSRRCRERDTYACCVSRAAVHDELQTGEVAQFGKWLSSRLSDLRALRLCLYLGSCRLVKSPSFMEVDAHAES